MVVIIFMLFKRVILSAVANWNIRLNKVRDFISRERSNKPV